MTDYDFIQAGFFQHFPKEGGLPTPEGIYYPGTPVFQYTHLAKDGTPLFALVAADYSACFFTVARELTSPALIVRDNFVLTDASELEKAVREFFDKHGGIGERVT